MLLQMVLQFLLIPQTTSVSIYNSISKNSIIIEDISIPSRLKVIKNKTEIENIRNVMIKDGVALTRFFYWLENNHGKMPMTEILYLISFSGSDYRRRIFLGHHLLQSRHLMRTVLFRIILLVQVPGRR